MTDTRAKTEPEWVPVLRALARVAGHELRNALNGLMVNLEVVRGRSETLDGVAQPFFRQAIEQAEESARLAESTIVLLKLLVSAVGEDGVLRIRYVAPDGVAIESTESEATLAAGHLEALARRTSLAADVSGGTVILSIAEKSPDSN